MSVCTRTFDLADEESTRRLAGALARRARPGDVVALSGPLGIGKTLLARAFVRALAGADEEVPSPTFTLVQTYDTAAGPVAHFDFYRIKTPEDALEIGLEDALCDSICLIEWPERLGPLLPRRRLDVALAAGADPSARRAILTSHGSPWDECLGELDR